MVAVLAAAADKKRGLSHGNKLMRMAVEDDLQDSFMDCGAVHHGRLSVQIVAFHATFRQVDVFVPADSCKDSTRHEQVEVYCHTAWKAPLKFRLIIQEQGEHHGELLR